MLETRQIGRYTVERLLARGGMAEVFLGRAVGPAGFTKRLVLKRILPEYAEDQEFVAMFLNEARLAALLEHQNIVQVFDFGEQDGSHFIAMEYVDGQSLRAIRRHAESAGTLLPLGPVIGWTLDVCDGLHYAHRLCDENGRSRGIVHRDVSPDNVLVSKTGIAKITDFGIAKVAAQGHLTAAGTLRGKFAYMSPEQVRGRRVDARADIYSLGVTLFELLAGRRPHVTQSQLALMRCIVEEDPPLLHTLRPDLDPELSAVVARALARAPDERYPDMGAFQEALAEWADRSGLKLAKAQASAIVEDVGGGRQGFSAASRAGKLDATLPAAATTTNGADLQATEILKTPAPASRQRESVATPSETAGDPGSGRPLQTLVTMSSPGAEAREPPALEETRSDAPRTEATAEALQAPEPSGPVAAKARSRRSFAAGLGAAVAAAALLFAYVSEQPAERLAGPAPGDTVPLGARMKASDEPGSAGGASGAEKPAAAPASPASGRTARAPTSSAGGRADPAPAMAARSSAAAPLPIASEASPRHSTASFEGARGAGASSLTAAGSVAPGPSPGASQESAHALKPRAAPVPGSQTPRQGATEAARQRESGRTSGRVADARQPKQRNASITSSPRRGEGFLTLRTAPWCEVYLDGEKIGTTPLNRMVVPAGTHRVLLVNEAASVRRPLTIEVLPDQEVVKRLVLE